MIDKQLILDSVGPVQAVLDAHDGVVNVVDTSDGVIMISLEGGCTGCSATPMTAMQIYYSLMKLDQVQDVVFTFTLIFHLYGVRFDCYSTLSFKVHII